MKKKKKARMRKFGNKKSEKLNINTRRFLLVIDQPKGQKINII